MQAILSAGLVLAGQITSACSGAALLMVGNVSIALHKG